MPFMTGDYWKRPLRGLAGAIFFAAGLGKTCPPAEAAELGAGVQQLAVSIAPGWDVDHGRMQLFERAGKHWKAVGAPWPVLYGKSGLVWGRGVLGADEPGPHKVERDKRAPAGVFRIGRIYTYDEALPAGANYPFHTVGAADAWVDDPNSPDYNRFVTISDPANPPPWFAKEKMRLNDFAYHWLVEIRHNSDPPVPGDGSAIFFHIRRGVDRPTAGCTTMAEGDLVQLIRWLRAEKNPHYALLPKSEYERKWQAWGLPSPEEAEALLRK
jgi:L,D-peptidoglycan transpeptidase YkuD (ErfK/YbiS/YcfS/YnhG family)